MYADKSNILTGILRHIHTHTRYIPSQPPHILINRKFLVEETRYIPILRSRPQSLLKVDFFVQSDSS